jgi:predicted ATP-dependent serine protease
MNWGTMENFSVIVGSAKSGKTYLSSYLAAGALWKSEKHGTKVLYVDTEQSKDRVQQVSKRIHRIIALEEESQHIDVLSLRACAVEERHGHLSTILRDQGHEYSLVIIDGIKDLVYSFIDEKECSNLVSDLMKWTEEKQIHIISVIHENKSNYQARGHLGGELVNKAELVVNIEKKAEKHLIRATHERSIEFFPLEFTIINDFPIVKECTETSENTKDKKLLRPNDFPEATNIDILRKSYSAGESLSQNMMAKNIRSSASSLGI